jgi:hypothetical protein
MFDALATIWEGGKNRRHDRKQSEKTRQFTSDMMDKGHQQAIELTTLGNQMDMDNQKEMFNYRIDQGMAQGLTPYEMFLGPAGGAGGGTSGSGQTLGNGGTQRAMEEARLNQQLQVTQSENEKARRADMAKAVMGVAGDLYKTKMQTEATTTAAETGAAATQYAADSQHKTSMKVARINEALKKGELDLRTKEFEKIALPMAEANLKISAEELKIKINEVATSDPKWQKMMKRLSMSAKNVLMEFAQNKFNIDATDPLQVRLLSEEQQRAFVKYVAAVDSNVFAEAAGMEQVEPMQQGGNWLGNLAGQVERGVQGWGQIIQDAWQGLKDHRNTLGNQ